MKTILLFSTMLFIGQVSFALENDTIRNKDPENNKREIFIVKNENGTVLVEGGFIANKKDGLWRKYSEKGALLEITMYKNDLKDGLEIIINKMGRLIREQYFKAGKANGVLRGFKTDKHGREDARLVIEEYYENGEVSGFKRKTYADGSPQEDGQWKAGKRDGVNKWYHKGGALLAEYIYNNGVLDGTYKAYYSNGKLRQEGAYANNLEEGEWKEYNEEGKLIKSIKYKKGEVIKTKEYKP